MRTSSARPSFSGLPAQSISSVTGTGFAAPSSSSLNVVTTIRIVPSPATAAIASNGSLEALTGSRFPSSRFSRTSALNDGFGTAS